MSVPIYVVVDIGAEGVEDVLTASTDKGTAIRFAQGAEGGFHVEVWEVEDGEPNEDHRCVFTTEPDATPDEWGCLTR